jgi:cytochrome b involved in lipid metabolism
MKKVFIFLGVVIIVALGVYLYNYFQDNKLSQYEVNNTQKENNLVSQTSTENMFSMEVVEKHNSKESCFTVINGNVYDLTKWIDKHPGGSENILGICGKDGTMAFQNQHGGEKKTERKLNEFYIGKLAN